MFKADVVYNLRTRLAYDQLDMPPHQTPMSRGEDSNEKGGELWILRH